MINALIKPHTLRNEYQITSSNTGSVLSQSLLFREVILYLFLSSFLMLKRLKAGIYALTVLNLNSAYRQLRLLSATRRKLLPGSDGG